MYINIFAFIVVLAILQVTIAKKKVEDPKECEVCVSVLEGIDKLVPKEKKTDKSSIEKAISTYCTLSGFGSDWKPNPNLSNPKDVKMCYAFEPMKKAVSLPYSTGMPKKKVCQRLKKDNPDICDMRYPIKVEKKEGEEINYGKMRVKDLKKILDQRGQKCNGCTEKSDFVKKCRETEHLDL